MSLIESEVRTTLERARELRILDDAELAEVMALFEPSYPFAGALRLADSLHAHVKVDDVSKLPHAELRAAGGTVENEKAGYIKYAYASGMNLIFSDIDVSQDDLRETACARRPRPFLDHHGIDLRREIAEVKSVFDALPGRAAELGWGHVPQGGEGKLVYCCHITVAAKHWLYPARQDGRRAIPIEFAYGPLAINPDRSGCDLRPADPAMGLSDAPACGSSAGAAGSTCQPTP